MRTSTAPSTLSIRGKVIFQAHYLTLVHQLRTHICWLHFTSTALNHQKRRDNLHSHCGAWGWVRNPVREEEAPVPRQGQRVSRGLRCWALAKDQGRCLEKRQRWLLETLHTLKTFPVSPAPTRAVNQLLQQTKHPTKPRQRHVPGVGRTVPPNTAWVAAHLSPLGATKGRFLPWGHRKRITLSSGDYTRTSLCPNHPCTE